MFEKNMKLSFLLDFYGEVLDPHTRTVMEGYYNDDLSLSEIAEDEGISRQGVRHVIKKGEEQLLYLEERLGLAEHYDALRRAANDLVSLRDRLAAEGKTEDAALLDGIASTILSKA